MRYAILLLAVLVAGCASVERNAYTATAVTVRSVDSAMSAYGDYVRAEIAALDTLDADQRAVRLAKLRSVNNDVRRAYEKYQAAVAIEAVAVRELKSDPNGKADWERALTALSKAASELIQIIKTL